MMKNRPKRGVHESGGYNPPTPAAPNLGIQVNKPKSQLGYWIVPEVMVGFFV